MLEHPLCGAGRRRLLCLFDRVLFLEAPLANRWVDLVKSFLKCLLPPPPEPLFRSHFEGVDVQFVLHCLSEQVGRALVPVVNGLSETG